MKNDYRGSVASFQHLDKASRMEVTSIHVTSAYDTSHDLEVVIDTIQHSTRLKEINFSYVPIPYMYDILAILNAMKHTKSVTTLNLSYTRITHSWFVEMVPILQENTQLVHLDLSGNMIEYGDGGMTCLAAYIEQNTHLQSLSLSSSAMTVQGIVTLSHAFKKNVTLIRLDLGHNWFRSTHGWNALADIILNNHTLSSISLNYNLVCDDGATILAHAIKHNHALTELYLAGCRIGDNGIAVLADSIKHNHTLTMIDLTCNCMGHAGIATFADAFKHNQTIKVLKLASTYIGDEGAEMLAYVLKYHNAIENVNLMSCGIGDVGAAALADAVKENKNITALDLYHNPIGEYGITALTNAVKQNRNMNLLKISWQSMINRAYNINTLAEAISQNIQFKALRAQGSC